MSYKAVEFAVEQSLSDVLFHVDSQERPVPLPEKTLVPPKRKWRVHVCSRWLLQSVPLPLKKRKIRWSITKRFVQTIIPRWEGLTDMLLKQCMKKTQNKVMMQYVSWEVKRNLFCIQCQQFVNMWTNAKPIQLSYFFDLRSWLNLLSYIAAKQNERSKCFQWRYVFLLYASSSFGPVHNDILL